LKEKVKNRNSVIILIWMKLLFSENKRIKILHSIDIIFFGLHQVSVEIREIWTQVLLINRTRKS